MGDVSNSSGIQGAIAAAKDALDEAQTALAEEMTNPANHGLERLIVELAAAQVNIGQAIKAAAHNVNK